jgi:hypothetical protein
MWCGGEESAQSRDTVSAECIHEKLGRRREERRRENMRSIG